MEGEERLSKKGGGEDKKGQSREKRRERNNQLSIDMQRGNREEAEQQMDAAVTLYCTQEHTYQPVTQEKVEYSRAEHYTVINLSVTESPDGLNI